MLERALDSARMKSFQFSEYGQPLRPFERPDPEPTGTEILLRIGACGACHSDVHMWQGYFDLGGERTLDVRGGRDLPFTLGHEIAGTVVAVGPGAEGVEEGDRGVVYPWIGCRDCEICARDEEHLCLRPRALGTFVDGGFADHVLVPHPRYLHGHGNVDPRVACTYACSGVTAYGALKKVEDRPGQHLVVLGAGGVGLSAVAIAPAVTDRELIVVDVREDKLEKARGLGAHHTVDAKDPGAHKAIKQLTGGGSYAILDCVGSEATAGLAMRSLAKSGILVMVGLFGGSLPVPLPFLPLKNLTIQGSDLGSPTEMRELMELVRGGAVPPIPIDARPLEQAQSALDDLVSGDAVGRVVLTP